MLRPPHELTARGVTVVRLEHYQPDTRLADLLVKEFDRLFRGV